jgi:hypothetical protein
MMMIVNGDQQPDLKVWATAGMPVHPNTTYYFSFFVTSVHSASPAILSFSINGERIGEDFSPTADVGLWTQACVPWFSGNATTADIAIVNQNTTYFGNDFALDDIDFDKAVPCAGEPLVFEPSQARPGAPPLDLAKG